MKMPMIIVKVQLLLIITKTLTLFTQSVQSLDKYFCSAGDKQEKKWLTLINLLPALLITRSDALQRRLIYGQEAANVVYFG